MKLISNEHLIKTGWQKHPHWEMGAKTYAKKVDGVYFSISLVLNKLFFKKENSKDWFDINNPLMTDVELDSFIKTLTNNSIE